MKKYPLFLLLLPLFFVLHGSTENFDFIPVKDAVLLTAGYLVFSLFFLLIFRLFYKNWMKAGIAASLIMAFHFFFGSLHDGLKNLFPGSLIVKYSFILPLSFCLLLFIIILLKKRKKTLQQLALYLNFLLILLILIDTVWLAGKKIAGRKNEAGLSKEFRSCNDCANPDVYVIIADEYAGNRELKDVLHYDNSPFLSQLTERGFHVVPGSSSNYNFTPYSIASTLNMDYLDLDRTGKKPLLAYTYETIRDNQLLKFLQSHQYRFYNHTHFDFKGQPARTAETFLPTKTKLITSQTFLSRVNKELGFHLVTTLKWKPSIRKIVYFTNNNNRSLLQLTIQAAGEKTAQPKFVLAHLMMPHYPYYYDKNGREFPFETLFEGQQVNELHYVEYLQYSNKRLLELVDAIIKNAERPPVIILMGDHGFRHFANKPVDIKYHYSNLMAVYLPGKDYSAFPDSLTNVNLFRTVLNTTFRQQLPYRKDTAFIMANP